MTAEEKATLARHGSIHGLWVAASFALPISFISRGFATGYISPTLVTISALLIVAHIVSTPILQRRQRQFLCSTNWARERGIQPESLKLFCFGRRK